MAYITNNLLQGEKIIYRTRPHRIVLVAPAIFMLIAIFIMAFTPTLKILKFHLFGIPDYKVFALIFLAVAIFYGINAIILHLASEYGITNKRIIMKTGWIERRSLEIFLGKAEAIYVNQSVPGRIFNYGIITIVGIGGTKDRFLYVPDPLKFRRIAQQQVDIKESKREYNTPLRKA